MIRGNNASATIHTACRSRSHTTPADKFNIDVMPSVAGSSWQALPPQIGGEQARLRDLEGLAKPKPGAPPKDQMVRGALPAALRALGKC